MRALTILALALAADLPPLAIGQAIAQDGAVAERLYREGTEARQAGRIDQAIETLSRAVGLTPDDADTQLQLGLSLFAKQRFGEAGTALRKALAIAPSYDDARFGLVRIALATRDLDEAGRELAILRQGGAEAAELQVLQGQLDAARVPTAAPEAPAFRGSQPATSRSEAQRVFLEGQDGKRVLRRRLGIRGWPESRTFRRTVIPV